MKRQINHWAQALTICAALAMNTVATSCSDDNDEPAKTADPEVTYQGNVAYSKGVLFADGTQLGNGSQHFHLTGDVTLKKGTYLLEVDGLLKDENGNLPSEDSFDGIHLTPDACKLWRSYLDTHTIQKSATERERSP